MEAWRQWPLGKENNDVSRSKKKIDLTPTGLLMKGGYIQYPARQGNECNLQGAPSHVAPGTRIIRNGLSPHRTAACDYYFAGTERSSRRAPFLAT